MLTRVTITGADDSIMPIHLKELSADFPFVEWGILFSRSSYGSARFPSEDWVSALAHVKRLNPSIRVSAHLCGTKYVRDFLRLGTCYWLNDMLEHADIFGRVQLNTHGLPHSVGNASNLSAELPGVEYIVQYDGVNDGVLSALLDAGVKCSVLFDTSHGTGVLPSEWPRPIEGVSCGYAGGLAPENLHRELQKISELCGDTPFWIDMETGVRSGKPSMFNYTRVVHALEIASRYLSPF